MARPSRSSTVNAGEKEPASIEASIRLKAGTRTVSVAFLNPYTEPPREGEAPKKADEPPRRLGFPPRPTEPDVHKRVLVVRGITLDGPYNPPPPVYPKQHRRIMDHPPGLAPREAARSIIERFAGRAFRRPVTPGELERFLKLYDQATAESERFEASVKLALEGVLVWPDFLFRVELDPPGATPGMVYPVGEYELASRLSYFLWSSMPDDELLKRAAEGRLRAELEPQVRRMLRDPKSTALVENFAGQWLTLRKLDYVGSRPDDVPDLRRGSEKGDGPRDRAVLRGDPPRGSERT